LEGKNIFVGEQDVCHYFVFKTHFSWHNKIWDWYKKFGEALPPNVTPWLRHGSDYLAVQTTIKHFTVPTIKTFLVEVSGTLS